MSAKPPVMGAAQAAKPRRRLLWIWMLALLGVGVLALLPLALHSRRARTPITEANCARIRKGMKKEEVETLLGGPPQTTVLRDSQGVYGYPPPRGDPCFGRMSWWSEEPNDCSILVGFDGSGQVMYAKFERPAGQPSVLHWVKDRLRRAPED